MRRSVTCVIVIALCLSSAVFASGKTTIAVAKRTDAGTFDGTWFYTSRDIHAAIWFRQGPDGVPEFKIRYQSMSSPERFETDWSGSASYSFGGSTGTFRLVDMEIDANQVTARLDWQLIRPGQVRRETADLLIYRAGEGRQLVMLFNDYTRTVTRGERKMVLTPNLAWKFTKASKRLALWEEIPF